MHFLHHTPDLSATGGSRNILDLSQYLCAQGHEVSIIIDANRIAFNVDPRIKLYLLKKGKLSPLSNQSQESAIDNYKSKKKKKAKKRTAFKRAIRKIQNIKRYFIKLLVFPVNYSIIRSFVAKNNIDFIASHNMYTFFEHFFYYPKDKFALMLRNSPNEVFLERGVVRLLPFKHYFNQRLCLGVSQATIDEIKALQFGVLDRSFAIYNPFDFNTIRENAKATPNCDYDIYNKRYILSLSSLDKRKRIDRILYALAQSSDKNIELVLVGTGPTQVELTELAESLGLSHRVHFLGFQDNPYPFIKQADMLVLASDSEGLPTVLIESLICGTPVISTDCPCGPSEILVDDLKEYLIPITNIKEEVIHHGIATCIDKLVQNRLPIEERHVARFSKESVVQNWINVASRDNERT
ncbi:glycosyltransferase [uncultured Vibrio sp.]|uniref:glycosyltransferase n=1 Tax=uncultured Vibrio sp. TaxID=114054 RepID=UPI0029C87A6E|nr:glycosyltransferase [uncultured Vibrio sp.]